MLIIDYFDLPLPPCACIKDACREELPGWKVGAGTFLPSTSIGFTRCAAWRRPALAPRCISRRDAGTESNPAAGSPGVVLGHPGGKMRACLLVPCGKEVLSECVRAFNFLNAEQKGGRTQVLCLAGLSCECRLGGRCCGVRAAGRAGEPALRR